MSVADPVVCESTVAMHDEPTIAHSATDLPIASPAAQQYFAAHPRRPHVYFGDYLLLQTGGYLGMFVAGIGYAPDGEVAPDADRDGRPDADPAKLSVYGLGEGTIHALTLAADTAPDAPKVHSLGLLQPLPGRYLDIITTRVAAGGSPATVAAWKAAVQQIRTQGTVPATLPDGLNAIANPGNIKAVVDADRIDPLALAAAVPPVASRSSTISTPSPSSPDRSGDMPLRTFNSPCVS